MTTFGVYEVVGRREYRGHAPGTRFEAILDPGAEQRAIARGDIRIVGHVTPTLEAGSFVYPDGWLPADSTVSNEAPAGASRVSGGG